MESATGVAAGGDEWDDDSDGDQDSDDDDDLYSALVGDDIGALCEMESEQNEFADDPIMLMDWKVRSCPCGNLHHRSPAGRAKPILCNRMLAVDTPHM